MGNWRNRLPRRFYREKPPCSPPTPHELENDNVPVWEKRFCAVIGSVPWWKVVHAKKLMFCTSNVLNWDDSAGEEAFHNAKRRFFAYINKLPCHISPPDPNKYVDKINWNPTIDPKLIEELDRAYFAPDDETKHGRQNKRAKTSSPDEYNRSQNPRDSQVDEVIVSNTNENPWEASHAQPSENTEVTGWGQSRDSSWGRDLEVNNTSPSKIWGNAWKHDSDAAPTFKDKGWHDTGYNRGHGDSSSSWKQRENHINDPKPSERKRNAAGWEPWDEGCKQREDSAYRCRFQGNGYQFGNSWSQGRAKKRVDFAS